ncbi:hypothetical protein CCUS01_06498 [Colletotrichum cuscutae]|uniref:Uncharacterized protein n=1 Tax=Colletotrichum cuscutae TaxID=1209917 RepID=A0AAI9V440_9PEZI|nr:hypothetical protein CCUS01_06498 [Colletotrichum cuscutae]
MVGVSIDTQFTQLSNNSFITRLNWLRLGLGKYSHLPNSWYNKSSMQPSAETMLTMQHSRVVLDSCELPAARPDPPSLTYAVGTMTLEFCSGNAVRTLINIEGYTAPLRKTNQYFRQLWHAAMGIRSIVKAGVKTFIPSDFGTPKGPNDVPEYRAILRKKAQAQALLEEKAKEDDKFTWTSFWNDPFLNRSQSMALFPNFGFDLKNHSATIYDSGNEIGNIPRRQKTDIARGTDELEKPGKKARSNCREVTLKGHPPVAQLYEDGAGRSVLDGADNELLEVEPEELDERSGLLRKGAASRRQISLASHLTK